MKFGERFTEEIYVAAYPLKFYRDFLSTIWDDFRPGHEGYLQVMRVDTEEEGERIKCSITFRPMDSIPHEAGKPVFRYVGNPLVGLTRL
jgi:hypothetical protein